MSLDRANMDSHGASFSPDGNWIIFTRLVATASGAQGYVSKISSSGTGQPVDLVSSGATPGFAARWSPAGDWIAYTKINPRGRRVAAGFARRSNAANAPRKVIPRLVFRWRRLAYLWCAARRRQEMGSLGAGRCDRRGAKVARLEIAPQIQVTHISLHPDGKRLLVTLLTEASDIWMIEGITK